MMGVQARPSTVTLAHSLVVDSSSSPPASSPLSPEPEDIDSVPPPAAPALFAKPNGTPKLNGASSLELAGPTRPGVHLQAKTSAKEKGSAEGKKKPGRKKKDDAATSASASASAILGSDKPVKEKKVRKVKDPNAPPTKRRKVGHDPTALAIKGAPMQSVSHAAAPMMPSHPAQATAYKTSNNHVVASTPPAFAQIGKNEAEHKPNATVASTSTVTHYGALQPPSRPSTSSGQRYDPIRSASAENANALLRNSAPPTRPNILSSTPNARASPSIASLIDPPSTYAPSHHSSNASHYTSPISVKPPLPASPLALNPPTQNSSASSSITASAVRTSHDSLASVTQSHDLSNGILKIAKPATVQQVIKTESLPRAPSPKPIRQKQASPPVPLGSGLLSNSAFGKPEAVPKQYAEVPNQCIVIEVPMTQETGNYVNFIREVENKYGFDVAHPRLAEHRRRMAQMAAAGAAIEADLGPIDEMPMDDSEIDSNVEMGGMEDDSTAQEGLKKKQKRKPRANEYDKHDGFIDDTEQLWEEQAMASSNGYFVWSGPLVPEPEKPADDKADGTVSKRGRGRGRGGTTRGETSGRGRGATGRGSRGGATVKAAKQPRITKAEKLKLESEQHEREKMAVVASKNVSDVMIEG